MKKNISCTRKNGPFIFQIPHHTKTPELLSSTVIALLTGFLLTFL